MLELNQGDEERFRVPEGTTEKVWHRAVWGHYDRWRKVCRRRSSLGTRDACGKAYIDTTGTVDKFALFCVEFPPLLEKPASKAKAVVEVRLCAIFGGAVAPQDNKDGAATFNLGMGGGDMTLALFHDEIYDISLQEAWGC